MSSCKAERVETSGRGRISRAGLGVALAVLAASLLSACGDSGFRPMYATVNGVGVADKLAAVEVATIGGKTGQRLRNELIFQTTGGGSPPPPIYKLEIVLTEALVPLLVRSNGESASAVYNLEAKFKLVDIKSKQVLLQGSSFGRAVFDRFQPIYSNVRAADDASARAARTIADDLKGRLAAILSGQPRS